MSFRSVLLKFRPLLVCLISLTAFAGLFFAGSMIGYEEFRGGYAVLSTDVSVDDRKLNSILNDEYAFAGKAVCESSQIVMLDNFNSMEIVPLDKYYSRIHSFDPRNDGYAGKLKNIFIKDGRRFVYIPVAAGSWNTSSLNKYLASLLGDIHYNVRYYGIGRPLYLFFAMYAAASLLVLIICCVKRKSHNGIFKAAALIPIFSPLAFFGASGLACAALFLALFVLMREPLSDLASPGDARLKDITRAASSFPAAYGKTFKQTRLTAFFKEIVIPSLRKSLQYRYYALMLFIFAAAFAVIIIFSQLNILFVLAVFAAAFAVFFFTLKILSIDNGKHRKFTPVMIIKRGIPDFAFSVYMLPFAAAVLITIIFTPFMSGSYISNNKFDSFVEEGDYHEHLAFQSSFSTRPIGSSAGFRADSDGFFFDTDGLPSMKVTASNQSENLHEFPPFPVQLKELMDFFHNVNSGQRTNIGIDITGALVAGRLFSIKFAELMSLLVLLLFIGAGFIFKRINDDSLHISFSNFKRIFHKFRMRYINWNKTLLYNGRSQKSLRGGTVPDRRKIKDA